MATSQNITLNKIKRALASAHLPAALPILPLQAAEPVVDPVTLVQPFTNELTAIRGKVYQATSSAHAIELLLQILRDADAQDVLAWDDGQLPVDGLGAAVRAAGFEILESNLPTDPTDRASTLTQLGQATVGITGALAGLADTGSLVLTSGPGQPRLASLLPPIHVALLPVASLLPNLPSLFTQHASLVEQGSNLILITGPSRTSDIELTAVYGVHGPKVIHVILV